MKKSAAKKKRRPKNRAVDSGPRRATASPLYDPIAQREKETVMEIIRSGATADKALEVGLSALVWADHTLARFDAEGDLSRPLACIVGCDHCCYNQVEVTLPEALVIGDFLAQRFSGEAQEWLLARVEQALAAKAGQDRRQIAGRRRELPCPMLVEHRCAIYPVRPLVCRGMHSLEAGQCESSLQAGDLTSAAYYLQRHELVRAIARGLLAGCQALSCQSGALDLALALRDYFREPDAAGRWIRGEMVFSI